MEVLESVVNLQITEEELCEIIQENVWLSEMHVQTFNSILQHYSSYTPCHVAYCEAVIWDPSSDAAKLVQPLPHNKSHIQLLYSSTELYGHVGGHWICCYYNDKDIFIYDSLNIGKLQEQHVVVLSKLFPYIDLYLLNEENFPKVQGQTNNYDCAIFAIANATSICFQLDPAKIKYNIPAMRNHLLQMFLLGELHIFPTTNFNSQNEISPNFKYGLQDKFRLLYIAHFQHILKNEFPSYECCVAQETNGSKLIGNPRIHNNSYVEILMNPLDNDHTEHSWICYQYVDNSLLIYDPSGLNILGKQCEKSLVALFPYFFEEKKVISFGDVQTIDNSSNSGFLAIAFWISILYNLRPERLHYSVPQLRHHFFHILQTQEISHFPCTFDEGIEFPFRNDIYNGNIIRENHQLNDNHVIHFHNILRHYTSFNAIDTLKLQNIERISSLPESRKHMQILYSSSAHWVTYYYDGRNIIIYDSMNQKNLHPDFEAVLRRLHPYHFEKGCRIYFPNVQTQNNAVDCGVFAIAYGVSIFFGYNPQFIVYEKKMMRNHLLEMFSRNIISHFPCEFSEPNERSVSIHLSPLRIFFKPLRCINELILSHDTYILAKRTTNLNFENSSNKIKLLHYNGPNDRVKKNSSIRNLQKTKVIHNNSSEDISDKKIDSPGINSKKKRQIHCTKFDYEWMLKSKETLILKIQSYLDENTPIRGHYQHRTEAEKIINLCSHFKNSLFPKLRYVFDNCRGKIEGCLTRCAHIPKENNLIDYVNSLCGARKHTPSNQPYFGDTVYRNINECKVLPPEEPHYLPIENACIHTNSPQQSKNYEWNCHQFCKKGNAYIINELDNLFRRILNMTLKDVDKDFCDSFKCSENKIPNKLGHPHNCYIDPSICKAIGLPLDILKCHFPELRTIAKLLSETRRIYYKMFDIDKYLRDGDVKALKNIAQEAEKTITSFPSARENNIIDEEDIKQNHKEAFDIFHKNSHDLPVTACCSCKRLCCKKNVTKLSRMTKPLDNQIWTDLQNIIGTKLDDSFICESCLKSIRHNEIPAFSVLNNTAAGDLPAEITCLNDTEVLLIQRAKPFQVIKRKESVMRNNLPNKYKMQMIAGQTFFLPLPLQKTIEKISHRNDPINTNLEMYILVRGVPNKSKVVFETVVDVVKVWKALKWYKENNPLYADVVLPDSPEALTTIINNIESPEITDMAPECTVFVEAQNEKKLATGTDHLPKDTNKIVDLDAPHEALLTGVESNNIFYENYTIFPIHEQRLNEKATDVYQQVKVHAQPLGHFERNLDLLCFPHLYPFGNNGQHELRNKNLRDQDFVKLKMMSEDARFRRNMQYLFFLLNDCNMRQLNGGIFQSLNIINPKEKLTKFKFLDRLSNEELEPILNTVFSRLRNTQAYWKKPTCDLHAMIRYYGPATWFITLSPSEWDNAELVKYLRDVNKDIDTSKMTANELIAMDPVSVTRFIDIQFKSVLDFLTSDNGPFGKVVHYYWRREYQTRGMEHFHMLVWVPDAPTLGKSSDYEIAQYIQKYVTCSLPDKNKNPLLFTRIQKTQKHIHNDYCQRRKKTINGFSTVCRFGFPRTITDSFILRNVQTSIAARRNLNSKTRLYDLPRTKDEEDINDYNLPLLLVWNGNVDVQFVGDDTSALTHYIVKYILKPEKNGDMNIMNSIQSTKSLSSRLWAFGMRMLNYRECGAIEAADTCLGFPLYGTDKETTIRWLDVNQVRNRKLKPLKEIKQLKDESTDIFYPSFIDTRYADRPKCLESMNLYDFAAWFEIENKKPNDTVEYYITDDHKYLVRRSKPYLINHYIFKIELQREKFCYALLLLKKPWRDEKELKDNYDTYAEAFIAQQDNMPEAVEYCDRLTKTEKTMEKMKQMIEEESKKMEDEMVGNKSIVEKNLEGVAIDGGAMLEFQGLVNQDEKFDWRTAVKSMNDDQLRIFNEVIESIRIGNKVYRKFISGEAGTGKSFIIKCLKYAIKEYFNKDIAVLAPTGLAAFNVSGMTIHRFFDLRVERKSKGGISEYVQLSDCSLKQAQQVLRNVALIIIDEISMVSNITLLYIHLRLVEICNTFHLEDGFFGNKNIMFFGDLLQLPPINENPVYVQLSKEQISKYVKSMGTVELWPKFDYDELTINMRQKDDPQYREILGRIRLGITNDSDTKILKTRNYTFKSTILSERVHELAAFLNTLPTHTVCILPTLEMCDALNAAMLHRN